MSIERAISGPGGYPMLETRENGVTSWFSPDARELGGFATREGLESALRSRSDSIVDNLRSRGFVFASADPEEAEVTVARGGKSATGILRRQPGKHPEFVVHYHGLARPYSGSTGQRPKGEWIERSLVEMAREVGHLPPLNDGEEEK